MNVKMFASAGRTVSIALDGYEGNNPRRWILVVEFPKLSPEEIKELLEDVGTPMLWRMERTCKDLAPKSVRPLCAAAQHLGKEPELLWKEMLDVRLN